MKTSLSLALGSALCLLLTSCVVTSENPLSSPETAHVDQALVGDWYGKKDQDTYRFSVMKGPWMHVEIIPAKAGDKGDSYDLFPTVIGDHTFLNVVMIGKDDQGHPTKAYVLFGIRSQETACSKCGGCPRMRPLPPFGPGSSRA